MKTSKVIAVLCLFIITSVSALADRPPIAGAFGDLNGDGVINNIDHLTIGHMVAGLLPYDPRADFGLKGRVTLFDWVALGAYVNGASTIVGLESGPAMKLLLPNSGSAFEANSSQIFVWGNRPGVTEVKFALSQGNGELYVSNSFPPTGQCTFTIPSGFQGTYTLTVYGTTGNGLVSDSITVGLNDIARPATPAVTVSVDRGSPTEAKRNATDQLLAVFQVNILNGEALYEIDFYAKAVMATGLAWKSEMVKRFEIRSANGAFLSGSERWNVPGQNFEQPPDDKPLGPGVSRKLVPTSKVMLDQTILISVYGSTPDADEFTTMLTDIAGMKPEDFGNLLKMDFPFSGQVSNTVTLK